MANASDDPSLEALRRRLDEEEAAYAELLATVDRLAAFPLPAEVLTDLPARVQILNQSWEAPPPPGGGGIRGWLRRRVWAIVAPALARQTEFNSALVQVLNGYLEETGRLHARLRELVSALIRYLQRVLPLVDARDRVASALTTARAELILEAFDRRQESQSRRLQGLLALRDRLETVSEEVRAVRGTLEARVPPPKLAAAAKRAAEDARYLAFENRFRGSREEIRARFLDYATLFQGLEPVLDLGCGRGEFLDLLRERGISARGVEANAAAAGECRDKGLEVVAADLVSFLRGEAKGSLGGVFAAQVAEHLPPAVLLEMLKEAHRVLRPGGLLVLETVNTRSLVGFLEVYNRDLTHERPLHSETLSFMAAAQGFTEVRVELRSPVDPSSRLQAIPPQGLPERAAALLNENVERLNGLLYGPLDYALIARR